MSMFMNLILNLPMSLNDAFTERVKEIAVEAGLRILEICPSESTPLSLKPLCFKNDASPLTAADLASHQWIVSQLEKLDSTIPILSEEGPIPDYDVRKSWTRYWLVDPLDGTKEFLNGSDEFTVNLALMEDQEPVLGVIYVPKKEKLYFARRDQGSWMQEGQSPSVRIVSSNPQLKEGLTLVESRSHPSSFEELEILLKDLPIRQRVQVGSSLKFCLLAEGSADLYARLTPTMEWDVAAGDCIFRNSCLQGQRKSPFVYNKPDLRNGPFIVGL